MKTTLAVLMAGLLWSAQPAIAHHAFAAEFDASKTITVQGAVNKVEWTNPHIWIYVDMKDADGVVSRWQCEGGSPNTLTRQGWSKDSLKAGDQVSIEGFRAKNGTNTCNSRVVTTADLLGGLGKASVFGALITLIACHQGLNASGGTEGVGRATTRTVVLTSIATLMADFMFTKLLMVFEV